MSGVDEPTTGDYETEEETGEDVSDSELYRDKFEKFRVEFTDVQESSREDREQCLRERRITFVPGGFWEDSSDVGESICNQYEGKAKFEVNKCRRAVTKTYNEYAANRIGVDFVSKDGRSADDLSELCDGLHRADEYDSNAKEAYDNAFRDGLGGGMSGWRYSTRYMDDTDPDDGRQRVTIEPLYDVESSVFFSPEVKGMDKTKARRMYIIQPIPKVDFQEEYGYIPEVDKQVDSKEFDWVTDDVIHVLEVFELVEESYVVETWESMDGSKRYNLNEKDLKEKKKKLLVTGHKKVGRRSIKRDRLHKYLMAGDRILKYYGIIPGDRQPVAMFYGDLVVVENLERTSGQTTWAVHLNMLFNMLISNLATNAAKSQDEVPILFAEQVIKHKKMWEDGNLKDWPFMLIDPIEDSNGNMIYNQNIPFTKPPQLPPVIAALISQLDADIKEILGNHDQGEEVVGNVSTETALLAQHNIDMNSYGYISNFAKTMEQGGRIWLGIMKDIAVQEDYETKVINENLEVSSVRMNYTTLGENAEEVRKNDLSRAKLDVMSSVGPSSKTARNAAFRNLSSLIGKTNDPNTDSVLIPAALMNIEGEGVVDDVRRHFRKILVGMGVVAPTDEEKRMLEEAAQNQQKSPQDLYLESEAAKNQSGIMLDQAKIEELRAKTLKLAQEANIENQQALMDAIERLGPTMNIQGNAQTTGYPIEPAQPPAL